MTEKKKDLQPCRVFIFCDDEATKKLLVKVAQKRGYAVTSMEYPKDCVVIREGGCACTQEIRCGDIMILARHFGRFRALDFLENQLKAGCRLVPANKLVIASTFDEKDEDRVKALGVEMMYLPFSIAKLQKWFDVCEERLAAM